MSLLSTGLSYFRRRKDRPTITNEKQSRVCALEPLEGRALLAATLTTVNSITADNRGYAQIRFNQAVQTATITAASVQVSVPGADKLIGTADDKKIATTLLLNKTKNVLTIQSKLPADVTYSIKLIGNLIKDANGLKLDGEFKTSGPSGNGVQGGDYKVKVVKDTGANPIVRYSTSLGDMDVKLYRGTTAGHVGLPKNVAYFLGYVNRGNYDEQVVTRSQPGFVVQWGKVKRNPVTGVFTAITKVGSLQDGDPTSSNLAGTIAYALGGGPTTASTDFFFNYTDNTELDTASISGGPFKAFGIVANAAGFKVLAKLNALHRLNLSNTTPLKDFHTLVNQFPVNATVPVFGETSNNGGGTTATSINPARDFVNVSRVSVLSKVSSLA